MLIEKNLAFRTLCYLANTFNYLYNQYVTYVLDRCSEDRKY